MFLEDPALDCASFMFFGQRIVLEKGEFQDFNVTQKNAMLKLD